ncbi:MAG: endonuclease/exonuclease/phosphatase [Muricauda sp.]|nr:endonuclease/exonuclease/phosphatase [Allomuricauda sp.]MBC71641.1 endonuclease/exonuclease/phosphatase [Allomuricauda sp.]|tara:strand:- start:1170 stop:2048 length:879 start_codon:yes stop_codon:yes gene_type:complete
MLGSCFAQNGKMQIKVMAWNILHGGNDIENGLQHVIDIIREVDPDIVLMVETYGSGKQIAENLGYNFHLCAPESTPLDDKSTNLSIFSKYPLGETLTTPYSFYLGGVEVFIRNQKVNVFANWFHYEPWADRPEQLGKSVQELLKWEKTGKKYEMVQNVLPYIKKYVAETDKVPMIIGGDFNTPSHLDWDENTKEFHNGLVVPWNATKVLEELGLKDSYREIHPNPRINPGITWDTKEKMDSHRIDYIFYKGNIRSVKSETYMSFMGEPLAIKGKQFTYPSDHGFIVTTFVLE